MWRICTVGRTAPVGVAGPRRAWPLDEEGPVDPNHTPPQGRASRHDEALESTPEETRQDRSSDDDLAPDWAPETPGAVGGVAIGTGTGAATRRQDRPDDEAPTAKESSDPRPR